MLKGINDMKRNIWILNHYATQQSKNRGGRHYWIAETLIEYGYSPTIFCASTLHGLDEAIDTYGKNYIINEVDNIPFIFVKTPKYKDNGISRINNMAAFYRRLFPVAKRYAIKHGKPDVILASSVHPLTLVAGINIARKFDIPCICEVRDLWPESIVAYGILKRDSIITKLLYMGEKWIYKNADAIIMTWEGGKDYIKEQGWDKDIDLSKISHINNGVAIDTFDKNSRNNVISDKNLSDKSFKNVIYTGSIRKVNNLGILLDAAKVIKNKGFDDIRFLIYGSGDQLEMLKERCKIEDINNVIFKGQVHKKYVPYILKNSHVNILHNSSTSLDKYGQSQNKLFEYLAAGKCIVQTYTTGYSILNKYNCGISVPVQSPEGIAKAVIKACNNETLNKTMGKNARKAAYDYDFGVLTKKLIDIVEKL